jgi:hypothetical protein
MVTTLGFAAFGLVGMMVARRSGTVRTVAIGSIIGILILGAVSLGSVTGLIPVLGQQWDNGRSFLGVVSPFPRTYGLTVQGHTVASMFPLPTAFLTVWLLRPGPIGVRLAAAVTAIAMLLIVVLFFQARVILLMAPVALTLVIAFSRRPNIWTATFLAAGVALVALAILPALAKTDAISTDLRLESYPIVVSTLMAEPSRFLLGVDTAALHVAVNTALTYGSLIPDAAPIHSIFLEEWAAGGIVALATLGALFVIPLRLAVKTWLVRPLTDLELVAFVAMGAMFIEAAINPGTANAGAMWLTIGTSWTVLHSGRRVTAPPHEPDLSSHSSEVAGS